MYPPEVAHMLIIWFTAKESVVKKSLESHNWFSFNMYPPEVAHMLIIWFTAQEIIVKKILESHNWFSFNIYPLEVAHIKNKSNLLCTLYKLVEFFITIRLIIIIILVLLRSHLLTPVGSTTGYPCGAVSSHISSS